MYIVYGLEDQRNHEVFYVGITDDIQARFSQHLRCDRSNLLKDARIQEMVAAGYLPLPRTLQIVGDLEQAKRRESYWIRHYHALDMPLTNQVIPVIQEHVIIVREKETVERLHARMSLEAQRAYVDDLHSQGMPKRDVMRHVKKYIDPHIVNAIFRVHQAVSFNDTVSVEQVQTLREQGHNQDEIIYMLWGARKGGSPKYKEARERYRAIVTFIETGQWPDVREA